MWVVLGAASTEGGVRNPGLLSNSLRQAPGVLIGSGLGRESPPLAPQSGGEVVLLHDRRSTAVHVDCCA